MDGSDFQATLKANIDAYGLQAHQLPSSLQALDTFVNNFISAIQLTMASIAPKVRPSPYTKVTSKQWWTPELSVLWHAYDRANLRLSTSHG